MSRCHPKHLFTFDPDDLVARAVLVQLLLEGIVSNVGDAGVVDDEEVIWAVVRESGGGDLGEDLEF